MTSTGGLPCGRYSSRVEPFFSCSTFEHVPCIVDSMSSLLVSVICVMT